MTRDQAFEFLDRTARGIAEMFGSSCETLVHDMGVPTHPILSIYNGHVSGRTVGSTLDILGTAKELDEDALFRDGEDGAVYAAVKALPPKYRAVVHLYYYEGYDQGEIGEILHISRTAVQTRMSRARMKLKHVLEGLGYGRLSG